MLYNYFYFVSVVQTLNSFELILNEQSNEQFLILETSENSPTGYKTTMFTQTPAQDQESE